jgi:hypothetical protein
MTDQRGEDYVGAKHRLRFFELAEPPSKARRALSTASGRVTELLNGKNNRHISPDAFSALGLQRWIRKSTHYQKIPLVGRSSHEFHPLPNNLVAAAQSV